VGEEREQLPVEERETMVDEEFEAHGILDEPEERERDEDDDVEGHSAVSAD
jgi:hypothetical protein